MPSIISLLILVQAYKRQEAFAKRHLVLVKKFNILDNPRNDVRFFFDIN